MTLTDPLDQAQIQDGPRVHCAAKKIFRILAAVAITLAAILLVTAQMHPAAMDYIEYWSSGKLLMHHADPYSQVGVFALEKAHGYVPAGPLIMLNPPWALFLVAPLGFGNVFAGLFLWTLAAIGCILAFIQLLEVPSKGRALAFGFAPVLAFAFAPALASVYGGQSSPFLLLGFSLFLRFHRSRPFFAGASLLLMAIKPHLFLVFWALLLVDCIYRRRFLILAGVASALAAGSAFSMCLDAHIWRHYFTLLRAFGHVHGFVPTLSMLFQALIDARAVWLLFVPSALAILWGFWYYTRWRHVWDWRIHGMLLMLVTVLVSPYGFFSDEIVLLPSIFYALTSPERRRYSGEMLLAINSLCLLLLMVAHAQLSSRAYLWTPMAWLVWFLYASKRPMLPGMNVPAQSTKGSSMEEGRCLTV